jgi:elongation factor G
MKDVPVTQVRNFALMGHSHSGKTTLADAMLHRMGVTPTMGSIDAGTSAVDWNPEEKERKQTIWAKACSGIYKTQAGTESEIVFIDTPGFVDFYGQVISGSRAVDTGLIVVDAASGIQVGTQRAWMRCEELNLPRGIVITGLDKDNVDFLQCIAGIQEAFGDKCVPVLLPAKDLSTFYSVLLSTDVPDEYAALVDKARQTIVEDAAETDDTLIEKYLAGGELTPEELAGGLHTAVNSKSLIPVFAVAAKQEFGVTELLEAICRYFPSPVDHGAVNAEGDFIEVGPNAPFAGIVWRTMHDPYAGHLAFIRVMGGTLTADCEIQNATKGVKEKVSGLIGINGEKQEPVQKASAGDIVAIAKLKRTQIGESLCALGESIVLPAITFPAPVVFHAVVSKNKGDDDKLITGLQRLVEDDPNIQLERNGETGDLILAGMGDVQIDVALQQLKKRQNLDLELHQPRVAYRETITGIGEGHYRHKKQSGGRGQFGEVFLRVDPLPEGEEAWFVNKVVGGAIPSNFIPAVEKGLVEGKEKGVLCGYPLENVRITVYDGRYHNVDSSEVAFKIAAARALRDATGKAHPVLLEPMMELRVTVPEQFMGDITGDMSQKRGRVLGMEAGGGGMQTIILEAPQAELFSYTSELRSITGGRGGFEMRFVRYDVVPSNVTQQIVKAASSDKEESAA